MIALWVLTAAVPLGLALGLAIVGLLPDRFAVPGRTWLIRLAPATVLPTAWLGLQAPDGDAVRIDWLLLSTGFTIDAVGRPLLVMAALLYGLALVMVARSDDERASALSGLLVLCFVGNAGMFIADDVITLYLCFTVMSLIGYALVIHYRTQNARRSGRIYLVLAMIGEVAVLIAAMMVVRAGGRDLTETAEVVAASENTGLIVGLLFIGFGIKVGVWPLHVWLPLAHPAAPTPASAVLSGSMIAGGLAGWLRMLPLGEIEMPAWGAVFVAGGLAGAFFAVFLGTMQANVKAVLAYSSISQMGFLSAMVGAALIAPDQAAAIVAAAALYATHHGIVKGALFIGVGLWDKQGAGGARWVIIVGLAVAGLSLAGLPLTSGYLAKDMAKYDAVYGVTVAGIDLVSLLALVGTGSVILVARGIWLLTHSSAQRGRPDVTLVGWAALIAISVPLLTWSAGHTGQVSPPGWFDPSAWWSQGWPVLAGLVLVAVGLWVSSKDVLPDWLGHPDGRAVPAGDLVVIEEWLTPRIRRSLEAGVGVVTRVNRGVAGAVKKAPAPARWFARAEQTLSGWRASGITIVGMASVFLALSWWGLA